MNTYKRANTAQSASQLDETTIALQNLGMRIRKAVADGYMRPQESSTTTLNVQRVPLPEKFNSQPPSLTYNGSTVSSLAGWEQEIERQPVQSLGAFQQYGKRQREDDVVGYANVNTGKQLSEYVSRYGELSFSEEF